VSGRVNTIDRLVAARRERVPPGQKLTEKFPVLDLGVKPNFHESHWRFAVEGQIADPIDVGWSNFQQLVPKVAQVSDFHCVTTWTKQDVSWAGFRFADVVKRVQPDESARYVHMHCGDGYTTNLSLEDLLADDVLLAFELDGGALPIEHGGPLRMVVPKLYAWKSAKFLRRLVFQDTDEPGYWEQRGYHHRGDPWKQERYS
jgi:DMSO/TMAO reductase YedYZ molybdopterin-dependent catalytic subunit